MRGAKPETETAGSVEQALSNLRIEVSQEERAAQLRKENAQDPSAQSARKPEAARLFEEILKQERGLSQESRAAQQEPRISQQELRVSQQELRVSQQELRVSQQELSGTTFSAGFDRRARAQERLAQRAARHANAERPLNGAKSIVRKSERGKVFAGATILDKLVSFVAFLIKSLERRLMGGFRRFFPGYRQQLQKQQQKQLQALTTKKNQSRQASKNGKRGAALSGR